MGQDSLVVAIFTNDSPLQEGREIVEQLSLKKNDASTIHLSSIAGNNTIDPGADDTNSSFGAMRFLDVVRESTTVLRSNVSNLMWAMLLLICPLSALHLSSSLHTQLATRLASHLQSVGRARWRQSSLHHSFHFFIAQTFLSHTLSAPIFFTLFLLGKALIIFVVSSTYSRRKPSFPLFSSIAFKLWKRLVYTHIYLYLLFVSLFSTSIWPLRLLAKVSTTLKFPAGVDLVMEIAMWVGYWLAFAYLVIVRNLATVICILEENHGIGAISKACQMVKGRIQLALSINLLTAVGTGMVESLYLYRVIGIEEGSYAIDTASRLWEGPLLIFMHSFFLLLDVIMSCVLYFICKSCASGIHKREGYSTP